jgi:hypothetical protein
MWELGFEISGADCDAIRNRENVRIDGRLAA